jgi:peroxisomal membrane protein 2
VLTDQLVYGPLQNALFISFLAAVVEGRSGASTLARLRGELPAVQSRGWRFWPVVSFVNQEFIPLKVGLLLSIQYI